MNYEKEKEKAKAYAEKVKQKQVLHKIKHKNDLEHKIPTHKIITGYLFLILNVILIYALISMWHFADLTHLGVLITDIAAQVATFLIYSHHSTAQNTSGGIVYESMMQEIKSRFHSTDESDDEPVG